MSELVIESFGFVGGIMLSICSIPEAIKSYREKNVILVGECFYYGLVEKLVFWFMR